LPISLPENQLWFKFQAKPSGIYFADLIDDMYYNLKYYDFKDRKIQKVVGEHVLYHNMFTVSADEKRVFILQSVRGDLDIAKFGLP
jgi:transcriptional activator of cad operon